jgi:hypothetical protein
MSTAAADEALAAVLVRIIDTLDVGLHLNAPAHPTGPEAAALVDELCRSSHIVVFSTAEPENHLIARPSSYWAELFAQHGYRAYNVLREAVWWNQRIPWWHRQNLLLFATDTAAKGWPAPTRRLDLAQPALLMPELRKPLDATVCIPWRPSPARLAAFDRVQRFWEMFGWPVIAADSDTEIFSLAQARNNAVRMARTPVVVIADADTLVDPLNIMRAVADPVGIWWPFTKYRVLSPDYLNTPPDQLASCPYENTWDGAGELGVGGCMVCTRKEYWRLGGQPPEFIGWGWEDTAFTLIVRTLSRARRLRGSVYAFEHNKPVDESEKYLGAVSDSPGWDRDIERNRALMAPYKRADRRAWVMRALVSKRGVST